MQLEELNTGHWGEYAGTNNNLFRVLTTANTVHAEKPNEFRKLIVDFLNES